MKTRPIGCVWTAIVVTLGMLATGCASSSGDHQSVARLEVLLDAKRQHLASLDRERAQLESEIRALEDAVRVVRGH